MEREIVETPRDRLNWPSRKPVESNICNYQKQLEGKEDMEIARGEILNGKTRRCQGINPDNPGDHSDQVDRMTVVLSRKGFHSKAGGMYSPLLNNGDYTFLPRPETGKTTPRGL